jgi:hypothetical protein
MEIVFQPAGKTDIDAIDPGSGPALSKKPTFLLLTLHEKRRHLMEISASIGQHGKPWENHLCLDSVNQ